MIENIVIKNTITLKSVEINMTTSNFVLVSADFGQISSSQQTYKYPNQIGSSVYTNTLETRTSNIIGYVIGESQAVIAHGKRTLNSLINPLHALDILIEDKYHITMYPDSTVKYAATVSENNEYMCKFEISGICNDPLFHSDKKLVQAAGVVPLFHFPLCIPQSEGIVLSKREPSLICSIENIGSIESGMTISFQASGAVVNPSLINIDTQECFKLNKTLVKDETVDICTVVGARSIVGKLSGETLSYFKYRDFDDNAWLQLYPGINYFRYNADSGLDNLSVYISYTDDYLEVDQ